MNQNRAMKHFCIRRINRIWYYGAISYLTRRAALRAAWQEVLSW